MPTNRDHPQFVEDCQTVAREGACAYTAPGFGGTYQLMLPKPGDGSIWIFTAMPFGDPGRAMDRIRGALYNHGRPGPWGVAA